MFSAKASSNIIPVSQSTKDVSHIDVVSHAFCLSSVADEDKAGKKTLGEVHIYAELKHDLSASLPDSFTICSTIMTTNCPSPAWPDFFTILDDDGAQLLAPTSNHASTESQFIIIFSKGASELSNGKIPPLFPNQCTIG